MGAGHRPLGGQTVLLEEPDAAELAAVPGGRGHAQAPAIKQARSVSRPRHRDIASGVR